MPYQTPQNILRLAKEAKGEADVECARCGRNPIGRIYRAKDQTVVCEPCAIADARGAATARCGRCGAQTVLKDLRLKDDKGRTVCPTCVQQIWVGMRSSHPASDEPPKEEPPAEDAPRAIRVRED